MKKISLIALLVLVGMLFAAPAVRAQEAQETEAQKKAKAIAALEDDEQLGIFLRDLSQEELAAYVSAVVEMGDAALLDRVSNALNAMGTDVQSVLAPATQTADNAAAAGADQAGTTEGEAGSDKLSAIADAIVANFGDAASMLDGKDFNTSNPVGNTSSLSMPEAE